MELSLLGQRIKLERKTRRLTLEVLSERIGISRNFLWEIESGRKTPALNTLYNMSKELNVSIDYLMGLTDEKERLTETKSSKAREEKISQILELLSGLNLNELNLICNIVRCFI